MDTFLSIVTGAMALACAGLTAVLVFTVWFISEHEGRREKRLRENMSYVAVSFAITGLVLVTPVTRWRMLGSSEHTLLHLLNIAIVTLIAILVSVALLKLAFSKRRR